VQQAGATQVRHQPTGQAAFSILVRRVSRRTENGDRAALLEHGATQNIGGSRWPRAIAATPGSIPLPVRHDRVRRHDRSFRHGVGYLEQADHVRVVLGIRRPASGGTAHLAGERGAGFVETWTSVRGVVKPDYRGVARRCVGESVEELRPSSRIDSGLVDLAGEIHYGRGLRLPLLGHMAPRDRSCTRRWRRRSRVGRPFGFNG